MTTQHVHETLAPGPRAMIGNLEPRPATLRPVRLHLFGRRCSRCGGELRPGVWTPLQLTTTCAPCVRAVVLGFERQKGAT